MTYARARLWLGISGVGTIVLLSAAMIAAQLPQKLFKTNESWQWTDAASLMGFVIAAVLFMLPIDVLGGYVLPRHFGRSAIGLNAFLRHWSVAVAIQSVLFVLVGLGILAAARWVGFVGAAAVIFCAAVGYLVLQGTLTRLLTKGKWHLEAQRLDRLMTRIGGWGLGRKPLLFIDHTDPGFTGGVVGLPGFETIIVPRKWCDVLSNDQLAAAVGRRIEAVESGSRTRGLLVAMGWILIGFFIGSLLPGAGVRSVAQLVTTSCGFTCWTFLGLLILPTISRQASYAVDNHVIRKGVPDGLLDDTITALDRLQDDEPQRSAIVETIFHPVPSVTNRRSFSGNSRVGAWHAARMTLFLSWACLGLLARAVHCNAGRPELWVMLPTD